MIVAKRSLLVLTLVAAIASGGLSGCASSANREAMTAGDTPITKKHPQSVAVRTAGGAETGAMDSSNVSDADLKAAIEDSISQTGVFKRVVQGKDSDYELSVSIVQLSKPIMGLSFTVDMETSWVLLKVADRSVVLRKSVKSSHTATVSDAFAGVTRLRLAVEGATRANIAQGLKELSDLSL